MCDGGIQQTKKGMVLIALYTVMMTLNNDNESFNSP